MAASARIGRSAMAYPDPRQAVAAQSAKPRERNQLSCGSPCSVLREGQCMAS